MKKMSNTNTNSYTMLSQAEKASKGWDTSSIARCAAKLREKVQKLTNAKGSGVLKTPENVRVNG